MHSSPLTHTNSLTLHKHKERMRGKHQKKLTRNAANKASNWATEPRRRRQRRRTLCRALYKINWAFLLEFIKRFTAQLDVATIRPTAESRVRQPESATQSESDFESDSVSEAHTQNLHSVPCWHQVQHPIRIVPSALLRFVRLALQEKNKKKPKIKEEKNPNKTNRIEIERQLCACCKSLENKKCSAKKKQENSKKKRINISNIC